MGLMNNLTASGKLPNGGSIVYNSEGIQKAQEVKKQFDAVLDDIKGIVQHVTQREEMKLKQYMAPQLNHAKNRINL